MVEEEDAELEELLNQRRKKLLQEINRGNSEKKLNQVNDKTETIVTEKYLTEKAKRYLAKNFSYGDRTKIEEALRFLISNNLVEPGIDVETIAYIARRVLGFDYKIYVEEEGEFKEV